MKNKQVIIFLLMTIVVGLLPLLPAVGAVTATSLTLTNTTGDAVQITINGKADGQIQLSFLPPGAAMLTTIVLGLTDSNGNFSTTISSGGYGIPQGSPVFATISGVQSAMTLWPNYTSSLTLTKTNIQLAVGQSLAIGGSTALILAANSQSTGITTSISGSQLTVTGVSLCSGTVTVCGANAGCSSVAVEVGGETGQTEITFSPDNPVINVGQSSSVAVFGGGNSGYNITLNSNPTALDPTLSGSRRVLWLFGKAAGTSTVTICSVESATNCSNLSVTVLNNSATTLSFSPNNITLIAGLTQSSIVSGGPDNHYYVSSNSDSSVARASLSGNVVTLVGGTKAGSTVVTVCSATINNSCGTLNVTLNTTTTASTNTISFSQNVVSVPQGETSKVTVLGGNSSGYSISANSNPNIVTASINSPSNIISLYGNALGSAIVTVCSASAGTTCASIYVTVTSALSTIILSQNTVSLVPGEKILISIIGGDAKTTIYSNSNPSVVTTFLNTSGNGVVLTGGTTSGTAVITICPTDTYSSKCSALLVTVKEAATNATIILPTSSSCIKLLRADGDSKVYLIKDGTKQRIKTEAEFNTAGYHWSDVMVTTSASIAAYPDAAITATPATTPAVCPKLLRADGDNKVYLIKDGTKQWIKTEAEFNTAGYHWSDVILTTNANMASYPDVLISPVVKVKVVKTPTLRVRQLNTTKSNVLGSVNENEIFTVLQENNGWYKIKTSTGITGWISGAYAVKL